MNNIFLDNFEYVEHGDLYFQVNNKYDAHFCEGELFEYIDFKMIYVGFSKFDGDSAHKRYTDEYMQKCRVRYLEENKKKYAKERRRMRYRYSWKDKDDLKNILDIVKKEYLSKAKQIMFTWS